MPTRPRCWICAGEFAEPFPTAGDMTHITCTTCGEYVITGSLLASPFPLPDSERCRFSFWSKRRQLEGRSPVSLTVNSVAAILEELPNPSNHEKADILLVSLTLLYPEPGKYFKLDNWRNRSLACARNDSEFEYFVRRLTDLMDIVSHPPGFQITGSGWERAARLTAQEASASKTAFVALWFKDEMLELWRTAFAPAIKRAGFEPRLANDPTHNEQIDARIIADLKQCRFVIADVTGARTGVYFEAGYALGLGRPVIWTCRRDSAKDMHFDTRQYNHILWDSEADLGEQLYYRIVATI
jgi:nucleoside 2-deoxyribosyltransferase